MGPASDEDDGAFSFLGDKHMRGADVLIDALKREGVDVLFGYPGGTIMPVYDALYDGALRHVLVRHEQAAALAADGYARATGRVGVCISTSGPGESSPRSKERKAGWRKISRAHSMALTHSRRSRSVER